MSLSSSAQPCPSTLRKPARGRLGTGARFTACALTAVTVTLFMGACGNDEAGTSDAATQLSDFRSRAAAGAQASYTATYDLEQSQDNGAADVSVAHTPTDLRLDITTRSSVTTSISTPTGTIACQSVAKAAATCVQASGPGKEPPAALNPGLRGVFTTTLDKLGQGFGTVEVLGAPSAGDANALCGRVTGNDVTNGLYCLLPNGVIDTANFASGSLDLTDQQGPPTSATFAPPATPKPLATTFS